MDKKPATDLKAATTDKQVASSTSDLDEFNVRDMYDEY
jgi:hypothetical protein